ncbi:MAG TPA: flagellar hook-length control protein FliK [Steroidobacteraceae bacterium]|nr:flagellar hook-length control protein FliK [Steroidobacteraceae bacterium]
MPAANLLSLASNGAPTAPTTGGTPAATSGAAPATGLGTAFDAILMLEELAASAVDAGVDAGSAELGTDAEIPADDLDGEDNIEDLDDPLAFLAGLMSIAPPPTQNAGDKGDQGSEQGGGESGSSGHAVAAIAMTLTDGSGGPILTDGVDATKTGAKSGDDAAAAKLLAAQAALTGLDAGQGKDKGDVAVSARALDLIHQAGRAVNTVDHAPIATHARDPRWAEEFNTRIAMMVGKAESVAALSLTPVDLGPVEVNITVKDSQASIQFGAAQAETRQLIEASLPKLRELLAAQGFNLTDASVSQGFSRQPQKAQAPSIPRPGGDGGDEVTPVAGRAIQLNRLLDTYA